jgi:hypothetical protein
MLALAKDAGVRITHLDPFVRWMAAALRVESFTAWGGFPAGR